MVSVPVFLRHWRSLRQAESGKLSIGLIVLLLCLSQVALWGLATAWAYKAPEIDSAEQFIWSFSLQNGYWKHPPLPSWIMHFLLRLFGPSIPLPFIAAQCAIVIAMALSWRLACEMMSRQRALIAMLLTSLVTYHNIGGDQFNHNTVLLPFQAAMSLCFFLAARRASLRWWLLTGVFAGLSMMVKYVAALPIAGLLIYFAIDRSLHTRRNLAGLLIALLASLLVLLPHLLWLFETRFMIFDYARMTVKASTGALGFLKATGSFLGNQVVRLLPLLLGVALLLRMARVQARSAGGAPGMADTTLALAHNDRLFIWLGAVLPLLLTLLFSVVTSTRLESRWGANLFLFSGLLAMMLVRCADTPRLLKSMLALTVFAHLVLVLGLVFGKSVVSEHYEKRTRANFPGKLLAQEAQNVWRAHTGAPLRIVVSDIWLGGNMAANTETRVAVLMFGLYSISPWVTPQQLHDCGALLLEDRTTEPFLPQGEFPAFEQLRDTAGARGEFSLPWATGKLRLDPHPHSTVRWAFIAPQAADRCTLK